MVSFQFHCPISEKLRRGNPVKLGGFCPKWPELCQKCDKMVQTGVNNVFICSVCYLINLGCLRNHFGLFTLTIWDTTIWDSFGVYIMRRFLYEREFIFLMLLLNITVYTLPLNKLTWNIIITSHKLMLFISKSRT